MLLSESYDSDMFSHLPRKTAHRRIFSTVCLGLAHGKSSRFDAVLGFAGAANSKRFDPAASLRAILTQQNEVRRQSTCDRGATDTELQE